MIKVAVNIACASSRVVWRKASASCGWAAVGCAATGAAAVEEDMVGKN